jgi:hypothetical protein
MSLAETHRNLIGFIFPAHTSIMSVEAKDSDGGKQWLAYWIIYSLVSILETFLPFIVSM